MLKNKNIQNDKKLRIIAGHYGSGKTTFAINYALELSNFCDNISIADLDVVNVYFRTREQKALLDNKNIKLLGSILEENTTDLPAVSADVLGAILDKDINTIVDLGGDETGSRAFASFKNYIDKNQTDLFIVANTAREQTQNIDSIITYTESIETTLNIKTTGIVSNTHLMNYTTIEHILKGFDICQSIAKQKNTEVKYVLIDKSMLDKVKKIEKYIDKEKIFILNYSIRDDYLL